MIQNQKFRPVDGPSVAVSNRTQKPTFNLSKEASHSLQDALEKLAGVDELAIIKKASVSNAFQLINEIKSVVMMKLGVSDHVASDISSQLLTKSEKIVKEYGGDQMTVINEIVEEMKNQSVSNVSVLNGAFDLQPTRHQSLNIEEQIKNRLMTELKTSARDADTLKVIIYKNAQDLAVILRPHKRDEISMAIIDLIISSGDTTVAYNIKSSPTLLESLKAKL